MLAHGLGEGPRFGTVAAGTLAHHGAGFIDDLHVASRGRPRGSARRSRSRPGSSPRVSLASPGSAGGDRARSSAAR